MGPAIELLGYNLQVLNKRLFRYSLRLHFVTIEIAVNRLCLREFQNSEIFPVNELSSNHLMSVHKTT